VHGEHSGRLGWWWVADESWFFHAAPIYPYPDPYVPPTVMSEPAPSEAPSYWYYCESMREYYPYVTDCPEGWRLVVPAEAS